MTKVEKIGIAVVGVMALFLFAFHLYLKITDRELDREHKNKLNEEMIQHKEKQAELDRIEMQKDHELELRRVKILEREIKLKEKELRDLDEAREQNNSPE